MKKSDLHTVLTLLLAVVSLLSTQVTVHGATITDTYPGYPNQWKGLTSNTIIVISLEEPVAMIGNVPDMTYCVKKASFSGLDFVLTDVVCDVEASDDRKTIKLYPQDLLDENELYSYKVNNINFEEGGSQQDVAGYFETGGNPIPILATQVDEADMCSDDGGSLLPNLTANYWCWTCHIYYQDVYPTLLDCVITP